MATSNKDNLKSWVFVLDHYKQLDSTRSSRKVKMLVALVQEIMATEIPQLFRAGQSTTLLRISTTPYHGLRKKDSYVTIRVTDKYAFSITRTIKRLPGGDVEYTHELADEDTVMACLARHLDVLWRATKYPPPTV